LNRRFEFQKRRQLFIRAHTRKRFPARCASAIRIVRSLQLRKAIKEGALETNPMTVFATLRQASSFTHDLASSEPPLNPRDDSLNQKSLERKFL
jgi:hypothetical protein